MVSRSETRRQSRRRGKAAQATLNNRRALRHQAFDEGVDHPERAQLARLLLWALHLEDLHHRGDQVDTVEAVELEIDHHVCFRHHALGFDLELLGNGGVDLGAELG